MHKNSLAVVTGASSGIGKSVALKLATLGYELALVSRNGEKLRHTVNEMKQNLPHQTTPFSPIIYETDVTDNKATESVIADLIFKGKKIGVLFNSAGILVGGTSGISHREFERVININIHGTFNMVHAVVPHMKENGFGYIFNIASLLGKEGRGHAGAYAASKHAIVGFSNSLGRELAENGIKVTTLCPSFTDTPMVKDSGVLKEKMIQTADIANTVEYLLNLSPEAYIREIVIECRSFIR